MSLRDRKKKHLSARLELRLNEHATESPEVNRRAGPPAVSAPCPGGRGLGRRRESLYSPCNCRARYGRGSADALLPNPRYDAIPSAKLP